MIIPTQQHLTTLRSLNKQGSEMAQAIVQHFDWFLDQEQWADPLPYLLLNWYITEDYDYLARATQVLPPSIPNGRNNSRDDSSKWPFYYEQLREYLNDEQRREWENRLNNWAAEILNYTRAVDSDEIIGHERGLRTIDRVLGTDYLQERIENIQTHQTHPADMKGIIETFIRRAKGGVWIEGTSYNLNTMMVFLLGVAINDDLDYFAGLREWLPDLARYLRFSVTDNLVEGEQHGEIEPDKAYSMEWHYRLPVMMLTAHLLDYQDKELLALIKERLKGVRTPPDLYPYWLGIANALWVFDPSQLDDPALPPYKPARGVFVAEGVGLVIAKTDTTYVQARLSNPLYVDHDGGTAGSKAGGFGDVRLWYRGNWVVDHPIGYGQDYTQERFNTCIPGGIEWQLNRRFVSAVQELGEPGWRRFEAVGESWANQGSPYRIPGTFNDVTFLDVWERRVLFLDYGEEGCELLVKDYYRLNQDVGFRPHWWIPESDRAVGPDGARYSINGIPVVMQVSGSRGMETSTDFGNWLRMRLITTRTEGEIVTTIRVGKRAETPAPAPSPVPPPKPAPKLLAVYKVGQLEYRAYDDGIRIEGFIPRIFPVE